MSAKDLISPYLNRFVAINQQKSFAKLELSCSNGKVSVNFFHDLGVIEEETPKPDNSQLSKEILNKVQGFFEVLDKQNNLNTLDVPDYLLCRISDEMMTDPVIIESGFTYEKE